MRNLKPRILRKVTWSDDCFKPHPHGLSVQEFELRDLDSSDIISPARIPDLLVPVS